MGMLGSQVYKGPATIPHADADFFAAFFLATNVRPHRRLLAAIALS